MALLLGQHVDKLPTDVEVRQIKDQSTDKYRITM